MNYIISDTLFTYPDPTFVTPVNTPTFGIMMLQMIAMLFLLSSVLYFALYIFKKLNSNVKFNSKNSFKLHGNIFLHSKQGLSAISYGKKIYIVSFSPNSVNLIDTIEDPDLFDNVINENNYKKFPDIFSFFTKKVKYDK